jgi:3-oxoacyl-[acyl-carrier protein] reductase
MSHGKIALITGGTRRIGLAIARRLARDGYGLALVYHANQEAAAQALAELLPLTHHVTTIQRDVATREGAFQAVREAQHVLGAVDLLVNNVGPFTPSNFMDTTVEAYEEMVAGNLGSVFHMCQATIPLMRAQGGGVIINLGSLNAEVARGAPNAALYHALKASVVSLTRSIARSEGSYGIRANVVNPGMVDTLGVSDNIVNAIPLRRLGTPEEVANAVAWLASEEAAYVNGTVLNVHGGLWA